LFPVLYKIKVFVCLLVHLFQFDAGWVQIQIYCNDTQRYTDRRALLYVRSKFTLITGGARGGAVVEALRYKPEGRVFDSRWCHWIFFY
jgi:hypothetical protein